MPAAVFNPEKRVARSIDRGGHQLSWPYKKHHTDSVWPSNVRYSPYASVSTVYTNRRQSFPARAHNHPPINRSSPAFAMIPFQHSTPQPFPNPKTVLGRECPRASTDKRPRQKRWCCSCKQSPPEPREMKQYYYYNLLFPSH